MKKNIILISILLIFPFVTFAVSDISELMALLTNLIKQATLIVAALALLFFFWGLANFIINAADETKRKEGKQIMLWGIIALFVMVSVWGLVGMLKTTFLKGSSSSTNLKTLPSLSPSGLNQLSPGPDYSGNSPFDFKPPSSSELLKKAE